MVEILLVAVMVGIPRVRAPEAGPLHGGDQVLIQFLVDARGRDRNLSPLRIGLRDAAEPSSIFHDRRGERWLTEIGRIAFAVDSAHQCWDVRIEPFGGLVEVLLVEPLVAPLAPRILVFGVDVSVHRLQNLLEAELQHSVRNSEAGDGNALFGIVRSKALD